jgi:hypothetical protein
VYFKEEMVMDKILANPMCTESKKGMNELIGTSRCSDSCTGNIRCVTS